MAKREYVRVHRLGDIDENVDGENYLARTVYEDRELIDIGIVDANGEKIMARQKMDAIGFVRWHHG
jgi:hypothetical protein